MIAAQSDSTLPRQQSPVINFWSALVISRVVKTFSYSIRKNDPTNPKKWSYRSLVLLIDHENTDRLNHFPDFDTKACDRSELFFMLVHFMVHHNLYSEILCGIVIPTLFGLLRGFANGSIDSPCTFLSLFNDEPVIGSNGEHTSVIKGVVEGYKDLLSDSLRKVSCYRLMTMQGIYFNFDAILLHIDVS